MKLAQCLLPLFVLMGTIPASADVLTDLFPPDTKVVFGLRVNSLAISPLAQTFAAQAQAAGANWLKIASLTGFSPLRDIDEVMLASTSAGQNPPALIVIAGRFDAPRSAQGSYRYHGVPMVGGEKDTDGVIAFLDGATAIAGDRALVRSAIDRRDGGAKIDPAFNDRITSLRQRYDVWGLGQKPEGFGSPIPMAKGLESIDRFQFGIQLATGLDLGAELHARSGPDAEKLNQMLQMVAAMLKSQQPAQSGVKFDLQMEGETLKVNVSIPEKALSQLIETENTALAAVTPSAAPVIAETTPPKPNPTPGTAPITDTVILKLPGKK